MSGKAFALDILRLASEERVILDDFSTDVFLYVGRTPISCSIVALAVRLFKLLWLMQYAMWLDEYALPDVESIYKETLYSNLPFHLFVLGDFNCISSLNESNLIGWAAGQK